MRGSLLTGLVLLLCSMALQAEEIYRRVDAAGGDSTSCSTPSMR